MVNEALAILGGVVTFITAIAGLGVALSTRRNNLASADSIIAKTALTLVTPLRARIDDLERVVKEQSAQIQSLQSTVAVQQATISQQAQTIRRQEGQINLLQAQVRALGGEPVDFDKGNKP